MMNKIIGTFYLITEKKRYELFEGHNCVYIKKQKLSINKYLPGYEFFFIIIIDENNVQILNPNRKLIINNKEIASDFTIKENTSIKIGDQIFSLAFVYNENNLETLIDLFMDDNLNSAIDITKLFFAYAQKLGITDRKAISIVMASIDIPEIDKL